jgi:hypothetical protein
MPRCRLNWWTSGERFVGADAFVACRRVTPKAGTIRLLEVSPLQDGRVLSVVRVDHRRRLLRDFLLPHRGRPHHRHRGVLGHAGGATGLAQRSRQLGWQRFDPLQDPRARPP